MKVGETHSNHRKRKTGNTHKPKGVDFPGQSLDIAT